LPEDYLNSNARNPVTAGRFSGLKGLIEIAFKKILKRFAPDNCHGLRLGIDSTTLDGQAKKPSTNNDLKHQARDTTAMKIDKNLGANFYQFLGFIFLSFFFKI
jgi:hypothetical protein